MLRDRAWREAVRGRGKGRKKCMEGSEVIVIEMFDDSRLIHFYRFHY